MDPAATNEVGKTVTDVGKIFGSAGIDGLILYSLLIGSFLLFLAFCLMMWLNSRERARSEARQAKQIEDFTNAATATADAIKDMATAVTSAASADMTFKQVMASQLVGCEERMRAIEAGKEPKP